MSTKQSNLNTEDGSEADQAEEAVETENMETGPTETDNEELSTEEQLAQAQETIKDYWDQIMRLRAEIENNRKRAERDVENAHKFALKNFVESLLPIIDSMEMGQVAAAADNATLDSIREGSGLTMNMLVQVLERNGLEQIDPLLVFGLPAFHHQHYGGLEHGVGQCQPCNRVPSLPWDCRVEVPS